jgi:hypothetical protein
MVIDRGAKILLADRGKDAKKFYVTNGRDDKNIVHIIYHIIASVQVCHSDKMQEKKRKKERKKSPIVSVNNSMYYIEIKSNGSR